MANPSAERIFYDKLVTILHEATQPEPTGRFEFSCYINGPRGSAGTRSFIYANRRELSVKWIRNAVKQLPERAELAVNSRYVIRDHKLHIPMIDFVTSDFHQVQLYKVQRIAASYDSSWLIAESGNSFHAYMGKLLDEKEWTAYLGELLLQTPPAHEGEAMPIDVRWIGHSLIRGYTALRCSCRTTAYRQLPRYLVGGRETKAAKPDHLVPGL